MDYKTCKICLEEKPIDKFQINNKVCKACKSRKHHKKEYFQNYYQENKDHIIDHQLALYYEKYKELNHPLPRGRPKKINSEKNV